MQPAFGSFIVKASRQSTKAVLVVAASAGAGKSRAMREETARNMASFEGDVAYMAPTLALADEAATHAVELGGAVFVLRGRSAEGVCTGPDIFADDTPLNLMAPGTGKTTTARIRVYGPDDCFWTRPAPLSFRISLRGRERQLRK